jgi:hypothetical protein
VYTDPVEDLLLVKPCEVSTVGRLFDLLREEMALPPAFEQLFLWDRAAPDGRPVVYATLGAVHRPLRAEVFIMAKVPLMMCQDLFERVLVIHRAPIQALDVLPYRSAAKQFVAVLLAPPEDGSFAIGEEGGVMRYALRAIPLTPAELALAKDAPEKALAMLRTAGALVADPLRDCVVEPERTRAQRWSLARELTAEWGERLYRRIRTLRVVWAEGAAAAFPIELTERQIAECRAILRHVDATAAGRRLPERHLPYATEQTEPPDARRILRRAMIVVALAERAWLDSATGEDREARRREILAWVEQSDLECELEPHETAILRCPIGRLSESETEWAVKNVESLSVLGWTLCLADLPSDRDPSSAAPLFKVFELPRRPPPVATTRSTAERIAYLERVFTLLWRLETYREKPDPMDMREASQDEGIWFGTLAVERLPLDDGDVIIGGRPLREAAPEVVLDWIHALRARLRAAAWLAGVHPLYSCAPADPW